MNPLLTGVWGAMVALAYWPGLTSAIWAPRIGLTVIGLAAVGSWPKAMPVAVKLMWWTVAGAGLSLFWTRDWLTGIGDLGWLVALGLIASAVWTFVALEGLVVGTLLGLMASSIFVLWQSLTLGPVEQIAAPAGLMFNRDWLAELAAPLAVWCLVRRWWPGLVIAGVPLVLCTSRVAWIGFGVGVGVYWAWRSFTRMTLLGLCLLLAGLLLPLLLGPDRLSSALLRLEGWKIGLAMVSLQGQGLGFWHSEIPFGHLVHSDVLSLVDEIGLLVLPALVACGLLARNAWRSLDALWPAETCCLATLACLASEACISFPLHNPSWALLAAACAGTVGRSWWMVDLGERECRSNDLEGRAA